MLWREENKQKRVPRIIEKWTRGSQNRLAPWLAVLEVRVHGSLRTTTSLRRDCRNPLWGRKDPLKIGMWVSSNQAILSQTTHDSRKKKTSRKPGNIILFNVWLIESICNFSWFWLRLSSQEKWTCSTGLANQLSSSPPPVIASEMDPILLISMFYFATTVLDLLFCLNVWLLTSKQWIYFM